MVAKRSAPETTTRNVGPLTGRAAFSPGSVNDKARTVDVLWSTGAKVLRSSWFDGQSYEELSMDPAHVRMGRLNNGAPFLADHRGALDSVMGVVVKGSAKLQNGQGVATVRFPAEGVDPKADQLFAKVRDGVVQNISVGYRTYKSEKVEGGDEKIPTFRAVDWEPYEISAVAMGADDQAGFRSANFNQPNECVFVTRKGSTMEIDNESSNDVVADERARVSAIRALCKTARLDARIENDLIKRGGDLNDVRNAIIDLMALRDQEHPTDNHYTPIDGGESVAYGRFAMGRTDTEKFNECAAAALVLRSGSSVVDHAIQTKARGFENSKLDAGDLAGLGLYEIAKRTVERAGLKTGGKSREQIASLALTHRSSALAAASDFGVLYEQAIGKILLGAYATAPDSWRAFCKVMTVQDFRASPRYRVGSFGTLDTITENDEYKNKAVPDGAKVSVTTATRGNIIGLSRQAIVNDDMGANADLASRFGRSAGLTIESDVYAALNSNAGLGPTVADANGNTLFHASRSNLGTGSAISVAGLDADRILMAQQKDISSNEFLDLKPSVLLVPISLGSTARRLNLAEFDNDGTALMKPNVVRGLFGTVVESPRLSGTRRYLFSDPGNAAALAVVFLEGNGEAPYMEQKQEFRRDGMEWKIRLDVKVQAFDPKGAVTNAGV